jgi:voltage-gated potassium channel
VKRAVISFAAAALCITAAGVAFSLTQHVGLLAGVYWSVATGATVGYGDVTAHNSAGMLISIVTILTTIPLLADAYSHLHLHRHRKMQRDKESERQ